MSGTNYKDFNLGKYNKLRLGLGMASNTQYPGINLFGAADNGLNYDPNRPLIQPYLSRQYFSYTPTTDVSAPADTTAAGGNTAPGGMVGPGVSGGAGAMQPLPDMGGVSDDGSGEWKPKKLPSWAKGLMLGAGIAGLRGGRGANSVPFQMLSSIAQAWKQKQVEDEARAKQEAEWKYLQEYRRLKLEQMRAGKTTGDDSAVDGKSG